jgi:hypothetical protein
LNATVNAAVKHLSEFGKDRFGDSLSKWANEKNLKALASKVASYERVKTVWQRDKDVRLQSFYYPSKVLLDGMKKDVRSLKDLPCTHNLVIEGTVGQGKSIFLRYLCVRELTSQSSGRIPVFVELKKISKSLTVNGLVMDELKVLGFDISETLFDFYSSSGKLALLFDGFDEIDDEHVRETLTTLEYWARRHPQLQLIVSCRPAGEIQKSAHFTTIKLAPLEQDDHRPFLQKIGVKDEALNGLLNAIQTSPVQIKDLLRTPLLLTLLVMVYKNEGVIPNELPDFFKLLFTTLFVRHDRTKPGLVRKHKAGLTEQKLERVFEAFCYSVLRHRFTVNLNSAHFSTCFDDAVRFTGESCDLNGFQHDITKVACLLQEDGIYLTFVHKSLLDFFPAMFIKHCTDLQAKKIYSAISRTHDQWRPTLGFLAILDRYRHAKYFAIPMIESMQKRFGMSDDGVTPSVVDRALKWYFEDARLDFTKIDSDEYEFNCFGPTQNANHFYFPLPELLDEWMEFELDESWNEMLRSRPEFGQQHISLSWREAIPELSLERLKANLEIFLLEMDFFLDELKKLVSDEDVKAELLADLDFNN